MSSVITSRLWAVYALVVQSSYFPRLVEAACAAQGVPYSRDALVYVASRPALYEAFRITVQGGAPQSVDVELERLIVENGSEVDAAIMGAITEFAAERNGGAGNGNA